MNKVTIYALEGSHEIRFMCTHLDVSEGVLGALGDHVHAHGVARRRPELDKEVAPRGHRLDPPQPGESEIF